MFESVDNVVSRLADQGYICDKRIGTVVYLAQQRSQLPSRHRNYRASGRQ